MSVLVGMLSFIYDKCFLSLFPQPFLVSHTLRETLIVYRIYELSSSGAAILQQSTVAISIRYVLLGASSASSTVPGLVRRSGGNSDVNVTITHSLLSWKGLMLDLLIKKSLTAWPALIGSAS